MPQDTYQCECKRQYYRDVDLNACVERDHAPLKCERCEKDEASWQRIDRNFCQRCIVPQIQEEGLIVETKRRRRAFLLGV